MILLIVITIVLRFECSGVNSGGVFYSSPLGGRVCRHGGEWMVGKCGGGGREHDAALALI